MTTKTRIRGFDALSELSQAGVADDRAEEVLAAVGHVPCMQCLGEMVKADASAAVVATAPAGIATAPRSKGTRPVP